MIRAYKYRIYPTKRQVETLNSHLAICCELYNAALQERRDAWLRERKSITRFDQIGQLPEIRRIRPDVAQVGTKVLDTVLARVDEAFKAFYRRARAKQNPGYPRFRSVRRYESMTFREIGTLFVENKLRLSKIGSVKIRLHRPVHGIVKRLTIKREAGRWFVTIVAECEARPLPSSIQTIGIDVGISAFATFSDGTAINNPRYYERARRQLRIAQRKVARREKRSKRRREAIQLLQRAFARVRNQRSDFHHKLSSTVINNFGFIAVEDLNVKGLARMKLAKQVHDAGWADFINKLCAKAEEAARIVVKVNPSGTSQTCICGARVEKTLSQRWHECPTCGLSAPRDHVSAQVILGRGLRLHALTVSLEAVA